MNKKILIVDDDKNIVELLKTLVTPIGCEIFTACDGAEAFSVYRREKPQLVILDIMMPKFSGYQVLHRMKKDESFKPFPKVLMLSAKSNPEDIRQAEMFKCDAYLTKPFEPEDLVKKVKELLDLKNYNL
ncbi:MAG: hypothetical protein A2539_09135 [Elusimicrobia bacterium RIFOXYD2_FULL_34_15]|nr:MAG: hypothetical protein A2539_09135 [Elusimicrobia bacterium RIFOXYD2_FULL_34_15]